MGLDDLHRDLGELKRDAARCEQRDSYRSGDRRLFSPVALLIGAGGAVSLAYLVYCAVAPGAHAITFAIAN